MKEGRFTPEVCLVFIVRRKLTDKTLKEFKIETVPHTIEDVPTDVIEVPYGFEARQNDDRWRPFLGGDAGIHYQVRQPVPSESQPSTRTRESTKL